MANTRIEILLQRTKELEHSRRQVLQALNKRQPFSLSTIQSSIITQAKIIQNKIDQTNKSFQSFTDKLTDKLDSLQPNANQSHLQQTITEMDLKIRRLQAQNRVLGLKLKQSEEKVKSLKEMLQSKEKLENEYGKKKRLIDQVGFKVGKLKTQMNRLKIINKAISNNFQLAKQSVLATIKQNNFSFTHRTNQINTNISSFEEQVYSTCSEISALTSLHLFPKQQITNNFSYFSKQLIQYLSTASFLTDTNIDLKGEMKKWLLCSIKSHISIQGKSSTRLVYRYDSLNKVNFHNYFDNKKNILLLVKLANGMLVGGFTKSAFEKENIEKPGKGFIFNLTKQLIFTVQKQTSYPVTYYDPYYIGFGNSELRIRSQQLKLYSNFGISSSAFDSKGKKLIDFLGSQSNEVDIEQYQIHQIIG